MIGISVGEKMDTKDFGKIAKCGVNGAGVIVSRYNYKCPCLNCGGCKNTPKCQWRHVLEIDPCTNEDIRAMVCQNCIKQTQEYER